MRGFAVSVVRAGSAWQATVICAGTQWDIERGDLSDTSIGSKGGLNCLGGISIPAIFGLLHASIDL